jgi:hypothetical protein
MERQGLFTPGVLTAMQVMTNHLSHGTVLEALLLSHEENEIRAAVPDIDEVLIFSRFHGAALPQSAHWPRLLRSFYLRYWCPATRYGMYELTDSR